MQRRSVQTRVATVADVDSLAELWNQLRQLGARAERAVNPLAVADAAQRLTEVILSENADVIIAIDVDDVAGLAVVRVVQPDPMSPTRVLQLSNLVVSDSHRRRGVGHALVAAAADYADGRAVDHVAAGIYPSLRDASRFFARLGFAPVAVERIAAVTSLQRRLGMSMVITDDRVRRRRVRAPLPVQRRLRTGTRGST